VITDYANGNIICMLVFGFLPPQCHRTLSWRPFYYNCNLFIYLYV